MEADEERVLEAIYLSINGYVCDLQGKLGNKRSMKCSMDDITLCLLCIDKEWQIQHQQKKKRVVFEDYRGAKGDE